VLEFSALVGLPCYTDARGHNADDGSSKQTSGRKHENHVGVVSAERAAHNERRCHGSHVGIEEVRAHAGDVANVVTNVVRDDGGVTGIVFPECRVPLCPRGPR
jgi:hypothetical protein